MITDASGRTRISTNRLIAMSLGLAVLLVIGISMVASSSNPDPTDVAAGSQSLVTSIVNAGIIVFREGLEAVLIFAAITASFLGGRQKYRRPVLMGVAAAFGVTVLTWFLMTTVVSSLPVSDDMLLAITGITAVVVLLLVMNWFFHKVYWTDHIKELNTKKRELVGASEAGGDMKYWGFFALGFTAVYREGFEVVLFLQNLNLVAGGRAVFFGVLVGLGGTAAVGFLTFFLHHKLPYKRMLVLTGVLLGLVLVVMVGGSARTLQSLGAIPTTPLGVSFPDWWARWFELVPTVETVLIQSLAAVFVVGSYYAAEWWSKEKRRRAREAAALQPVLTPAPAASFAPIPVGVQHHAVPSAQQVLAATAALPELALRAPSLAGSNAAVRVVERTPAERLALQTVCGHAATTLCGCDAREPIAAAQIAASAPAQPTLTPAAHPTTQAPDFTPRPLFADFANGVPEGAIAGREPVFQHRPLFPSAD